MFAVLKTGGKQYKVQAGDVLRVEKLDAVAGEKIQFNEILMVGTVIGVPFVPGAAVQAEVIDQIKGEKTISYHKRRRKHSSQRTRGHRQHLTLLRVTDVLEKGADKTGIKAATGTADARRAAHEAPGAVKAEKPAKAAAAKPAKVAAAPVAEAVAVPGSRPANLLTEARGGKADDLKLIVGVGPKFEKLLHRNGVYHFDQIAAWTPDEVAYMDEQMESFKGRIARENWIEQSAKLAADAKE